MTPKQPLEVDQYGRISQRPKSEIAVLSAEWIVTENPLTRQTRIIPPGLQIGDPLYHDFGDGFLFRAQFDSKEKAEKFAETMSFHKIEITMDTSGIDFSGDQYYKQIARSLRQLADEFDQHNFPREVMDRHLRPIGTVKSRA